jgi:hypothetical protein
MTPPKFPHASTSRILEHMQPDQLYTSPELAAHFGVPTQYIQDALCRMRNAGDIERIPGTGRLCSWAKVANRAAPVLKTSVAGPAYAPDLKSTMRGYDAAFRTRAELAMMGRGR